MKSVSEKLLKAEVFVILAEMQMEKREFYKICVQSFKV